MLVKETGMSKEGAIAEVRRYTQTPGYALSYLLGKHLILQLKKDIRQKMGSKFDEKLFHDTITANGYLPVSMVRKILAKDRKTLNLILSPYLSEYCVALGFWGVPLFQTSARAKFSVDISTSVKMVFCS